MRSCHEKRTRRIIDISGFVSNFVESLNSDFFYILTRLILFISIYSCLIDKKTKQIMFDLNCSERGSWIHELQSCNCTYGWSGDHCDDIICFNDGTPNAERRWCNCPLIFTGQFCDKVACDLGSRPYENFTRCQCPDDYHYSGDLCDVLFCENGGAAVGPECVCTVWYSAPYCHDRSIGYYACIVFAVVVCLLFAAMITRNIIFMMMRRRMRKMEQENTNGSLRSLGPPSHVDQLLADTSIYSSTADNGSIKFARNGREPSVMSDIPEVMTYDKGSRKLRHY